MEVGWFCGRLGLQRVFLWLQDKVELPSDLQGAAWTLSEDIDSAWKSIETFLVKLRNPINSDTELSYEGTIPLARNTTINKEASLNSSAIKN